MAGRHGGAPPPRHARPGEPIVRVDHVTKQFGDGPRAVTAVDDVCLTIPAGQSLALMGPSGSGKTTLLTLIGALDRPTTGRIVLDGLDISAVPERRLYLVRRRTVGFVFQDFFLVPHLSALENVLLPTLPLGRDEGVRQRAEELLVTVGLGDRIGHRPNQLSGGQMQRVAIARALILDPPLVLADEPTGNLDSASGAEVVRILLELNRTQGTTLVVATHDERVVSRLERCVQMRDGALVADHAAAAGADGPVGRDLGPVASR